MRTKEEEKVIENRKTEILKYEESGYSFENDLYYLKNFYGIFNFLNPSDFINLMRYLSKVV